MRYSHGLFIKVFLSPMPEKFGEMQTSITDCESRGETQLIAVFIHTIAREAA